MNKPNFREWPTLKLSEVLKPISRKVAVESGREYDLIGVRWYNAGAHIHQTLPGENISTKALTQIREDDIIYNKMWVTKNAFAVAKKEHNGAFGTMEYPQFRALPEKLVPKFIEYLFHNPRFQYDAHRLCKGTTGRARLNPSDFLKLEAGIPSLAEQHKIAEILSTWDKAIAKTEQLIAALQERKKGLMQRLLTGEVRFPGFDGKWKTVRFADILNIQIGRTPARNEPSYWDRDKQGNNIWLSISDLSGKFVGDSKEYISDEGVIASNSTLVPRGTVLMSFKLTIGRAAIASRDVYTNEAICALKPKSDSVVSNRFLYHALSVVRFDKEIDQAVKGQTLNMKKIRRLEISLPSYSEQLKIADTIDTFDEGIFLQEGHLDKLQQQKKGLMQRLLTGQVRVRV